MLSSRRQFLTRTSSLLAGAGLAWAGARSLAQVAAPAPVPTDRPIPGDRPARKAPGVEVLNPMGRVPVSLIIDDSTCLVNLNKFAVPQFAETFPSARIYATGWRDWPNEIPDSFVQKFGEWCAEHGIKGKYSIVPFPACVGRLDRLIPGWTQKQLKDSIDLVRKLMVPNWDIHPEMVTHTRVIDLKTGHPYTDTSAKFMENWEWTTGRSTDEIGQYMAYALNILKNIGLPCEGITTPGGFGNRALPQLAQGTLQAVRDVYSAEIPHYFRHMYTEGDRSVAPRVEYASGVDGNDPRCVVSIIGCAGDWTGGWDNTPPGGADKFITEDLKTGRMIDIINRGEPAIMVAHWTGIFWNGKELGFNIFQEVVRRLHARYDNLTWMNLSEISRYWAARELTQIESADGQCTFSAPFACPHFTVKLDAPPKGNLRLRAGENVKSLTEVASPLKLAPGMWCRDGAKSIACFALPKGRSQLQVG